jgi:hypothetical protein
LYGVNLVLLDTLTMNNHPLKIAPAPLESGTAAAARELVTLTVQRIVSVGEIHVEVPAGVTWSQWRLIEFRPSGGAAKLLNADDTYSECDEDMAHDVIPSDTSFEGKCIDKDLYLAKIQQDAPAEGPDEDSLTAGEIAGVTIAVVALVGIVSTFAIYWYVKGRHAPAEDASL